MIKEKDYLKAKKVVQEYEKQLNISDVISQLKSLKKRVKKLEEKKKTHELTETPLRRQ